MSMPASILSDAPAPLPAEDLFEVWARFRGSHYFVSTKARVWNAERRQFVKPYLNSPAEGKRYLRVELRLEPGVRSAFYLHRLVAEVHVPGRTEDRNQVGHTPGDDPSEIASNHASRLRWITLHENLSEREGYEPTTAERYYTEIAPF